MTKTEVSFTEHKSCGVIQCFVGREDFPEGAAQGLALKGTRDIQRKLSKDTWDSKCFLILSHLFLKLQETMFCLSIGRGLSQYQG